MKNFTHNKSNVYVIFHTICQNNMQKQNKKRKRVIAITHQFWQQKTFTKSKRNTHDKRQKQKKIIIALLSFPHIHVIYFLKVPISFF